MLKMCYEIPGEPVHFKDFQTEIQALNYGKYLCLKYKGPVRCAVDSACFGIKFEPPEEYQDIDYKFIKKGDSLYGSR